MKLVGIKKKRALALASLALAFGGTAFYLLAKIGIPRSELPSVFCLNSCTLEPAFHQAISNSKLLNYDRTLVVEIVS